jgi:DNA polymerase
MARQVGDDNRARFQTRYHGAQTGRQTGTGFQPLNLTRGIADLDPDQLVRDIMYGDATWLDMLYGDATHAVSAASRHWIMAAPGNKIIAGDFVSVEAVILACLAGETWKIEAFRSGVKIYEHMADKIYNLPSGTVTKQTHPQERQDGKTGELAFGYQGALGAWLKFDSSGRHTDERIVEICKAWRAEHPAIVSFWYAMQRAAVAAVKAPGVVQAVGSSGVAFETVDEWLSMILPNGKRIWYYGPHLVMGMPPWHKPATEEDCREGKCDCKPQSQLAYMAQKSGQWKRVRTYGGKLTENCVQATSRELLQPAARRLEAAGYPVILTVYDEVVTETPDSDRYNQAELVKIMSVMPEWAADWPITVDPWEGERYRK